MIKALLSAAAVSAVLLTGVAGASAATPAQRTASTEVVHLRPVGTSHALGTATITYSMMHHRTTVVLRMVHLTVGMHFAHFHLGSCGSNGAIKYSLNSLRGPGSAMSTTVFPFKVTGHLYINVHGTPKNALKVVACGDLM